MLAALAATEGREGMTERRGREAGSRGRWFEADALIIWVSGMAEVNYHETCCVKPERDLRGAEGK